jgi:hypothetical protein
LVIEDPRQTAFSITKPDYTITQSQLLNFLVRPVAPTLAAELIQFKTLRRGLLVLRGRVILVLALGALQRDDFSWHC